MSLLSLPNELLHHICRYLEYADDVNTLCQSCHLLYSLVNPLLFPHYAKKRQLDAILHAMRTGDHVLMDRLIKAGVDLSTYVEATHHGPFHVAAREGHLGIVRVLLELDPNKDQLHGESTYGYLPLVNALLNGHLETARFMISQGAIPDFTEPADERTALSFVAEKGPLDSVRFLLEEATPDLEARDPNGWTPLLYAVSRGSLEVLRYMVKAGADPKVKDNQGKTSLFHAAKQNQEEMVLLLLENAENSSFFLKELDGISLARIACEGKGRIANLLLKRINLNEMISSAASDELSLFLFTSAACGSDSFVQLLLNKGCDPLVKILLEKGPRMELPGLEEETEYHKYNNPLRQAAANGHLSVLWLLLGSIRDTSKLGSSILDIIHIASETNEFRLLRDILDSEMAQQLNPTTLSTCISEALHLAVPHEEVIQLLLNRGAILDKNGDNGFHILKQAVKQGKHAVMEMLLEKATGLKRVATWSDHFNYLSLLDTAIQHGNLEMIKTLLETNDNINFHPEDEGWQQTLSSAVSRSNVESVEYFLDHGFDVNCRAPQGLYAGTPLLILATSPRAPDAMVKLLLDRGAEVDITDTSQRTALYWTTRRDFTKVQILLDHGADPLHRDIEDRTPLDESVSGFKGKPMKDILRAMEVRGVHYDLTDVIREAEQSWHPPQEEDKRIKYLMQHRCRMMYPCL